MLSPSPRAFGARRLDSLGGLQPPTPYGRGSPCSGHHSKGFKGDHYAVTVTTSNRRLAGEDQDSSIRPHSLPR